MGKKRNILEKTDVELYKGAQTTLQVSKINHKRFEEYCKPQKITKYDALEEIIAFLHKSQMPLSVLNDRFEISQMNQLIRNYHNYTTGVLANFENKFINILDNYNKENQEFLIKSMSLLVNSKSVDSTILSQVFTLLRALISADLEDKFASVLLDETLKKVNDAKNKTIDFRENISESKDTIIEGRVGKEPKIEISSKKRLMHFIFTLAENNFSNNQKDVKWHDMVIWEGSFSSDLGLNNQDLLRNYFNKINTGDFLKVKGYNKLSEYTDKEGKPQVRNSFVVTKILIHTSKK